MLQAIRSWWTSLPLSRGVGFREAAKNPRLWKALSMERAFAKETAATITDGGLANLAEYFIFEIDHGDDAWLAGQTLREVEPARLCRLLETLLSNPDNAGRLETTRAKPAKSRGETPIERICGLMEDGICPSSVSKFAGHPEESI